MEYVGFLERHGEFLGACGSLSMTGGVNHAGTSKDFRGQSKDLGP